MCRAPPNLMPSRGWQAKGIFYSHDNSQRALLSPRGNTRTEEQEHLHIMQVYFDNYSNHYNFDYYSMYLYCPACHN